MQLLFRTSRLFLFAAIPLVGLLNCAAASAQNSRAELAAKGSFAAATPLVAARRASIAAALKLPLPIKTLTEKMDAIKQIIFAANSDTFIKFCFCSRFGFSNHD